jgi:hypothetical protein
MHHETIWGNGGTAAFTVWTRSILVPSLYERGTVQFTSDCIGLLSFCGLQVEEVYGSCDCILNASIFSML